MQRATCATTLPDDAGFCLRCAASIAGTFAFAPPVPVAVDPICLALERALGVQYEIGPLLGRGGMDALLGRGAAQLTHSNIVTLYTFGETDGLAFFVMGFVHGESLAGRIRREGRFPFAGVYARSLLWGVLLRWGVVLPGLPTDSVVPRADRDRTTGGGAHDARAYQTARALALVVSRAPRVRSGAE